MISQRASEVLRAPLRVRECAFAFVFEKVVDRREEHAGAARVDPDVEVESSRK